MPAVHSARPHRSRWRGRRRSLAVTILTILSALALLVSAPATAAPPDERLADALAPIDPQNWENPDHMTWGDHRAIPGVNWADPSLEPTVRTFKGALVLGDFPDQPFLVTQPIGSDPFGSPTPAAHDIPRDQVAEFYRNFLNTPQDINNGHTINEYWMEDSAGRYGVTLDAYGPYRLPGKLHEYGLNEFDEEEWCPAGDNCERSIRRDLDDLWEADQGEDVGDRYDFVFFIAAGHDESSTWQEFGEMRFTQDTVPEAFGPPDDSLPNWSGTRYVEWTSWRAARNIWPRAGGGTSIQAESSGIGVYAHEFSHILGIGDNYNNPYGTPLSRSYTGIWEMLSRGSFNGPGGPHTRWNVPPVQGGSAGAHHTLRNKIELEIVDEAQVLRLSRAALAETGMVVATVTARAIPIGERFGRDGPSGINVAMEGGDLSPPCSVEEDPLCDRGGYENYTVEVVDRVGFDSFTPDSGVLLAKTKNRDRAPFIWVIDAHPEDIGLVDFIRPDGTPQMITMGDYRQLADALFKAGTRSGSQDEWVDEANRLHFYVLDVHRDADGVLTYRVAVRSLDGSGPHRRGARLEAGHPRGVVPARLATCFFPLTNTGKVAPTPGGHPDDVSDLVRSDVYRLSARASGRGWKAILPTALVDAAAGDTISVPVQALRTRGGAARTQVTLTATSESDPTVQATSTCNVHVRDTTR